MTADDIRHMGEDDLLDMDYFLNEDEMFDEDFPVLKVFISSKNLSFICYAFSVRATFQKFKSSL